MSSPEDTGIFLDRLPGLIAALPQGWAADYAADELIVTRAPGRLDLMGGIADYSGSLVLQLPIAEATHVALRKLRRHELRIATFPKNVRRPPRLFRMPLTAFADNSGSPIEYAEARRRFDADPEHQWAAYVAGAFLVLMRECGARFAGGAQILIASQVPEGKGVSSSAALEVAAMQAIAVAFGITLAPRDMAFLCQRVENLVAGAPCGVMDQMTSACGEENRLLALLCQPGEIQGTIPLPEELAVWGIDSGIRHAVTGADYGTVRTAAFMGYRMIAHLAGLIARKTGRSGVVEIEDDRWHGYLANLTPEEFDSQFRVHLPERISGAEFLSLYDGITDTVTAVDPQRNYPVLAATKHPIYENAGVRRYAEILNHWSEPESARLGDLMYASHASYSACGLGSSGTDELVRLVAEAGSAEGLYGAKITGGGCGGTVAVLGRRDAGPMIVRIARQYADLTGHQPLILSGSSPGAGVFGHRRIKEESRENAECTELTENAE